MLATTLAAFAHSDPIKLHHELFGGNRKTMRACKDPTTKMARWFGQMERTQPMAGVVGFKWKPYVTDSDAGYNDAWDWVVQHNVSVVWMTRNLLDVRISHQKHAAGGLQAHCKPGDNECVAEHRDVKISLNASTLVAQLEDDAERYDTNLSQAMKAKGVNFIRVMFEHLFIEQEDAQHTRVYLRPRLGPDASLYRPDSYDPDHWRPDPLAAWNRIFSFVGVEQKEDYSEIQRVASLEYERTDARTNCDSIENLFEVQSALSGTRFELLLGCRARNAFGFA